MDEEVIALMDELHAAGAEPWEYAVALVGLLGEDDARALSMAALEQMQ